MSKEFIFGLVVVPVGQNRRHKCPTLRLDPSVVPDAVLDCVVRLTGPGTIPLDHQMQTIQCCPEHPSRYGPDAKGWPSAEPWPDQVEEIRVLLSCINLRVQTGLM